jgi:hypothetical protein
MGLLPKNFRLMTDIRYSVVMSRSQPDSGKMRLLCVLLKLVGSCYDVPDTTATAEVNYFGGSIVVSCISAECVKTFRLRFISIRRQVYLKSIGD